MLSTYYMDKDMFTESPRRRGVTACPSSAAGSLYRDSRHALLESLSGSRGQAPLEARRLRRLAHLQRGLLTGQALIEGEAVLNLSPSSESITPKASG